MAMHTGGSPSFIEMDDARVELNRNALAVLSDAAKSNFDKLEHLAGLSGQFWSGLTMTDVIYNAFGTARSQYMSTDMGSVT